MSVPFDPWSDGAVSYALSKVRGNHDRLLAELERVRSLRQDEGSSLADAITSWPLTPVSFCRAQPAVHSSSTQQTDHSLRMAILGHPGGIIRFDPLWVERDVRGLLEITRGMVQTDAPFPTPFNIVDRWASELTTEFSVHAYLYPQLAPMLDYTLAEVRPPADDMRYKFTFGPSGDGAVISYGVNKPDMLFGLGHEDPAEANMVEILLSGEVKLESTKTLIVMRWIIWWARQEYRVQERTVPVTPETREKATALAILRQVWGQQVAQRVRRLFLTNGDCFIMFAVRAPYRINSYVSNIYFSNGDVDTYDGRQHPSPQSERVPGPAPWPHVPGLLAALAFASTEGEEAGEEWEPSGSEGSDDPDVVPSGDSDDQEDMGEGRDPSFPGSKERPASARVQPLRQSARQRVRMARAASFRGLHLAVSPLFKDSSLSDLRRIEPSQRGRLIDTQRPTPELSPTTVPCSPDTALESLDFTLGDQQTVKPKKCLPDERFAFTSYLGSGSFADVFSGSLITRDRTIQCAFKFVHADTFKRCNWGDRGRPCSSRTALLTLRAEAGRLQALDQLAPTFYGYWEGRDVGGRPFAFFAMELLGPAATTDMTPNEKQSLVRLLARVHAAGYVHGDIELRHFRRTLKQPTAEDDGWRLIDFEHAQPVNPQVAASELEWLRGLLGIRASDS